MNVRRNLKGDTMSQSPTTNSALHPWLETLSALLPGMLFSFAIAAVALLVQKGTGLASLSPLMVAMILGLLLRNLLGPRLLGPGLLGSGLVKSGPRLAAGMTFTMRQLLRLAVVLLGLQITFAPIAAAGVSGVAILATVLVSTFLVTKALGRLMGVEARLAELIAAGTSICGASAVMACNTVTRGSDEDVAYAIACVTVFGSAAMLILPFLAVLPGLTAEGYGFWVGATVHEVAQVVAAGFAKGDVAGHMGTIAKLTRVMMLAPLVLTLGVIATRRNRGEAAGRFEMPWFVLGFVAMAGLNSAVTIPAQLHDGLVVTTTFLLTAALAAMGYETDIRRLCKKGIRPFALAAIASLYIVVAGFLLVTNFL